MVTVLRVGPGRYHCLAGDPAFDEQYSDMVCEGMRTVPGVLCAADLSAHHRPPGRPGGVAIEIVVDPAALDEGAVKAHLRSVLLGCADVMHRLLACLADK